MPRKKDLTNGDALALLAEKLMASADAPNIFGYEPHSKQYVFHTSEQRKRLYIGGNRSGKTVGGIVEDIWWLTHTHPYRQTPTEPVRGRVVSVDFKNGIEKIILPLFKQWLPASFLIDGSWDASYDKQLAILTLNNGSFVEFMSYDQELDKFAGTSRHFVHFDEEPPKSIFTECTARLVDTRGSWWMTMTPVEGMTWVFDDIYEPALLSSPGAASVVEVSMTDNPYLDPEAVQEFLDSLDEDERKAREHGQFVQLGGLIYKQFNSDTHVVPPWLPPSDWKEQGWLVIASMDSGYNNPTAWLWHAVDPDGDVITFHEHYLAGATVEVHAAAVHKFNREVLKSEPTFYIGDPSIRNNTPTTGTSVHFEYVKLGIPIVLGNNDVAAGINRVSRYLKLRPNGKPRWVITSDCVALIREIKRYRWKVYASKKIAADNNLKDEPQKKDDHALDSARYFFMSRPDLRPDPPTTVKPHDLLGVAHVSAAPMRAHPNRQPSAPGDYITEGVGTSGSDTQWTYDELGGVW